MEQDNTLDQHLLDELLKAQEEVAKSIQEQIEREKLDPPDRKRVEGPGMFWCVFPKEVWVKGEKDPCVSLEWGWAACLTEEEIQHLADDAPRGKNQLIITREQALELRDRLNDILGE